MRRKHSNKPVCLNCKIRKKWREIVCHFCRFGRTSVVNLAKGFGAPNLNLTEHSTAINLLYQNHFDLKFYPRSLKLEDPPKVTRDANLHARQRHTNNNPKSFITWIQKHRILIGHFRVPKPSLSKWGQAQNLSCENEFYLHENEKSFPYQRLST